MSTALTSTEPMTANWNSCSGVESTFAPRSSTCVWPVTDGSAAMIAGRSMPGRVFSTKRAVAMSAPVLPALTQACASPRLTRSMATRMDESFLLRSAWEGSSSMRTCWEACTTEIRLEGGRAWRAISRSRMLLSPTRIRVSSGCSSRTRNAAGTTTEGPWSPPIASSATVRSKAYSSLAGTTLRPR